MLHQCTWGDRPNISKLIEKIANGTIPVGKDSSKTTTKVVLSSAIAALRKAIAVLESIER